MATILKSIADALDARVESATLGLGLDCIKGYPGFGRPGLSLPISSITFESDEPYVDKRVGKRTDAYVSVFTLAIYASNELELWSYLDLARAMFQGWGQDIINNISVSITPGRFQRVAYEQGLTEDEKRYAAEGPVFFSYAS